MVMRLVGIVLVAVGLALAVVTVIRVGAAPVAQRLAGQGGSDSLVGIALPLVAAVCFAAGLILIAVGMGHWNRPRHHAEPGDAVVDPEAHHKMDHV